MLHLRTLASLVASIGLACASPVAWSHAGPDRCCPADLTSDGVVDGADLAGLLADWDSAGSNEPADLDGSGSVDAGDLALLLGAWGDCPTPGSAACLTTLVVGSVLFPDGSPAEDAVILTQFGGNGVSLGDGSFSFEVIPERGASALQVTAVAARAGINYTGKALITPIVFDVANDAGTIVLTASAECVGELGWLPGFGMPGVSDTVAALTVFDDGNGPALYAGGQFTSAGGVAANRVAKWDGDTWSSLGTGPTNGVNNLVSSLAVFDDGTGPALYAGGSFTSAGGVAAQRVAKWDGSAWSSLGTGAANGTNSIVYALTVFDDGAGDGPALYAGGLFVSAGGVAANRIARWDGTTWSSLGTGAANGTSDLVIAMTVFDDGGGPALYAGGTFGAAGGQIANRIAKWDGNAWSPLGNGATNGVNDNVTTLTVFDAGDGAALYAGGGFTTAGGEAAHRIARWDGRSWSSLGTGSANGLNDWVSAIAVFDDGNGPALYAGGSFTTAGGDPANRIARWDGNSWSSLGAGTTEGLDDTVSELTVFDDGSGVGPTLIVGGLFTNAGDLAVNGIAQWSNDAWSSIGVRPSNGMNDTVLALTVFDDGAGPALYAGGSFTTAGDALASSIARWNGSSWTSLTGGAGDGVNGTVRAIAVFEDDGGPALYVGGDFTIAGNLNANRIARWDGRSWSTLGQGASNGVNNSVLAMSVFDDGTGPKLHVGGSFTVAGGIAANRIARWSGDGWSQLGTGLGNGVSGEIRALAVFDDGSGPALYVGGSFTLAGGSAANRIAKWNGSAWSSLGIGSANGTGGPVNALAVFDDGTGPALFAGGLYATAGGGAASNIAKWNGTSWSSLGSGLTGGTNGAIRVLSVVDSGGGPTLYAGGFFSMAGGFTANNIATWNGDSWSPLGTGAAVGTSSEVRTLSVFDDGGGPALYLGGFFESAGGVPSGGIAQWGCASAGNARSGE